MFADFLGRLGVGLEVVKFWAIMADGGDNSPKDTEMHGDAWGVKKLISHTLRNLRQDRSPRALWLHWWIRFQPMFYS